MIEEFIEQYYNDFIPYKTKSWCYEDGILLKATLDLYLATKNEKYKDFIISYLDKFIDDNGKALGYKRENYSTDDVEPATVLPWAYEETHKEKFKKAIEIFKTHLEWQPRTRCGNYFHKLRYPYQVWMDGLYMAQPFSLITAINDNNDEKIHDIINQFNNVRKYLFDEKRKLYVHAYDEAHYMQWANKEDGKAPNVWSRALGWMMMALVDIIEIAKNKYDMTSLINMYIELVDGLIPYLDNETKMIYQVVDAKDDKDNYLETSGSAMLAYSLIKAYRIGIVDEKYHKLGHEVFDGICKKYLVKRDNRYYLGGICQVAGLDNEKRDGSKSYYYSEAKVENEVKGVAPFIMAYSEILREKEE